MGRLISGRVDENVAAARSPRHLFSGESGNDRSRQLPVRSPSHPLQSVLWSAMTVSKQAFPREEAVHSAAMRRRPSPINLKLADLSRRTSKRRPRRRSVIAEGIDLGCDDTVEVRYLIADAVFRLWKSPRLPYCQSCASNRPSSPLPDLASVLSLASLQRSANVQCHLDRRPSFATHVPLYLSETLNCGSSTSSTDLALRQLMTSKCTVSGFMTKSGCSVKSA